MLAALQPVEREGREQHHPDADLLVEGRYVHEDQAVGEGGKEQGADQGAEQAEVAAEVEEAGNGGVSAAA